MIEMNQDAMGNEEINTNDQSESNNHETDCGVAHPDIVAEDELGFSDDKEVATHVGRSFIRICYAVTDLIRAVPPLIRSIWKKLLLLLRLCWAAVIQLFCVVFDKLYVFAIIGRALWKAWIWIVRLEVNILTVGTHTVVPKARVADDHLLKAEE